MDKETNMNAITMLVADHTKVKAMFKQFESEKNEDARKELADQAILELQIHMAIEEELFYPAALAGTADDPDLLHEAYEEHHVAKAVIAELQEMHGREANYVAKFIVLTENVVHHMREEEADLFPAVKKSKVDLAALGQKMAKRREALEAGGLPDDTEKSSTRGAEDWRSVASR